NNYKKKKKKKKNALLPPPPTDLRTKPNLVRRISTPDGRCPFPESEAFFPL
ncbi:unnamed protein product, partial [Brassica oleracea]